MRILTRYILREVTSHALLGGVLFTFVLFTTRLSPLLELVVRNSASFTDVARLIAYFLPEALIVTIPMAVLVGILLGLSRLARRFRDHCHARVGHGCLRLRSHRLPRLPRRRSALGLANSIYLAPRAADFAPQA